MPLTIPHNNDGWIFDIYHLKDKMIIWIKEKEGNATKRIEHEWFSSLYVVSDSKEELSFLSKNPQILPFVKSFEFVEKFEHPSDDIKKTVLKIQVLDSSKITTLAKKIENICRYFGHYRLYNVDVTPEQSFLYQKDIYPLGLFRIKKNIGSEDCDDATKYNILCDEHDAVDSFDYVTPNFKIISFEIISERKTNFNNFDDKITAIRIVTYDLDGKTMKDSFLISEDSELETILVFSYEVNRIDPDIILTTGGDQSLFPHILYRAKINKIETQLLVNLNREKNQDFLKKKNRPFLQMDLTKKDPDSLLSTSYISYGTVYFKPKPFFLFGRLHIDIKTSFLYKETSLDGLAEISRVCRIPVQIASRATIGKCLSSLYFYNAYKKDILIPWKPATSEIFKTFDDILRVDKGGFIFESKPGAYDGVAEFDFISLYPNIMLKKNVSSETINCGCCKNKQSNKVPGFENLYYTCTKKTGIVPLSLNTILKRRLEYKRRIRKNIVNDYDFVKYNQRQAALKWILVTSFGYLGFSNSKFGRIDAHIVVCAYARDVLLKTSKIAESYGFEVIHGIVDSIWIKKRSKTLPINNPSFILADSTIPYGDLKKEIERQTNFSISFEGVYKWIVFDVSKNNTGLPALNRYFGVFDNGIIKTRGIETRRHDTPQLFVKFQNELLQTMSCCASVSQVTKMRCVLDNIYKKYQNLIYSNSVSLSDLVFTKRISKSSTEYGNRNTIENCVIKTMAKHGKLLHPGEEIKYIITNFYDKNSLERALPLALCNNKRPFRFDEGRYLELLSDTYDSIIKFFY